MKFRCVAGIALTCVALCVRCNTGAPPTPADCSVPVDRLLRRLELDLPGATRVTRSVDIPGRYGSPDRSIRNEHQLAARSARGGRRGRDGRQRAAPMVATSPDRRERSRAQGGCHGHRPRTRARQGGRADIPPRIPGRPALRGFLARDGQRRRRVLARRHDLSEPRSTRHPAPPSKPTNPRSPRMRAPRASSDPADSTKRRRASFTRLR